MSQLNKFKSGIGWGGLSIVLMVCFQLVFMAAMARLLEPADFGLVAIANVILRFLSYFAQMGITPAIIQKPNLEEGDLGAALSVSITISTFFCLLAIATAPLVGQFFVIPELSLVAQVLALNFIIGGLGAVSAGLLRRKTQFKTLAIIDTVAYVFGYGAVGLPLAYAGAGVWALVGATTSQASLSLILSYAATRHELKLKHTVAQRSHFLSFGGRYSISGFLEFLTANLDALIIGKTLGASSAGIYNRALLISNLPVQQPANLITKALFPILSSLADQRDKQYIGYQLGTLAVGGYAFAVSAGIAAAAPDLVLVLLGDKWNDAIPVLQVLALSVGPLFVSHVASVTVDSLGILSKKIKIQSGSLALLVILMYWAIPYGMVGLACAVVVTEWVRMIAYILTMRGVLNGPVRDWLLFPVILVIFAGCAGGLVLGAAAVLPGDVRPLLRLLLEVFSGATSLVFAFLISRSLLYKLSAIRWLLNRLPRLARAFSNKG